MIKTTRQYKRNNTNKHITLLCKEHNEHVDDDDDDDDDDDHDDICLNCVYNTYIYIYIHAYIHTCHNTYLIYVVYIYIYIYNNIRTSCSTSGPASRRRPPWASAWSGTTRPVNTT